MAQKITHLTARVGSDVPATAPSVPAAPDGVSSLEATLPPTPLKKLLAADGAAVFVLSSDFALVDAITTAGGDQFPMQVVPTFKTLRSLVESGQCKIALIDAEPLGDAAHARIAELRAIESELVIVVAAPREIAEALMGLFSERVIHRLLIKPPALGITRLLLESAVSRFLQLREAHQATLNEPLVASRRTRGANAQGSRSAWILATGLVTALVVGVLIGGYLRVDSGDTSAPESATTAERFAAPTDAPQTASTMEAVKAAEPDSGPPIATELEPESESGDIVTALAANTEAALPTDGETPTRAETSPPAADLSDVALSALVAAAAPVADEPEPIRAARPVPVVATPPSELDSLVALAQARVEQGQILEPAGNSARDYVERALALESDNEEALAVGAVVGAAVVDSARVVLGSGDIERASTLADDARRLGAPSEALALLGLDIAAARDAAAARTQAQGQLLATGNARMRQDRLVTPEGDSAFFYLERLRNENPAYPGLESARRNFGTLLTERADTAIAEKNWADAESWIAWLERIAAPATVDAVRVELAAGRLQEEYLTTPARPGELSIRTVGEVRYPEQAARFDVDGWVETEFVVGADGVPRGARVVDASPRGWFEESALETVALYRYEPFERGGRVYERLARLRVRFDLR
jgi:TonB family protein